MDMTTWRIIIVDDDSEIGESVAEFLEEVLAPGADNASVTAVEDFDEGLQRLKSSRYDIAIIDVREGHYNQTPETEAGQRLLNSLMDARFLPIIFYTGLPALVRHLSNPPFIQVVAKGGTHEPLEDAVQTVLNSQLPQVNRALVDYIDSIQRDYMWRFVAKNWDKITNEADRTAVAYLLARRLAFTMSDPTTTRLGQDLGSRFSTSAETDEIHPMQYYVMPPVEELPMMAGDIYKGEIHGQQAHWVMITPTCDIAQKKADRLMLASCHHLLERPEYQTWVSNQSRGSLDRLRNLLRNSGDRYLFLPAAMDIPDLVVDFQNVVTVPRNTFESLELERMATLDSPFAEALTSQFSRLYGRIGTPDLNTDRVIERLAGC